MSYFNQNPLILVGILTILLAPFILKLASNQSKKNKQNLKSLFIFILFTQIILGFFVDVNFFLVISFLQIILLIINKSFNILVVILNFINSVVIFMEMINMSNKVGYQIFSIPAIGAVFLVLIGNVLGLVFINKDKNLLKKYFKV